MELTAEQFMLKENETLKNEITMLKIKHVGELMKLENEMLWKLTKALEQRPIIKCSCEHD